MSFSGHQPYDPTAGATPRQPVIITSDGFFPGINVPEFVAIARISDEYRDEAIQDALRESILECNKALMHQKSLWMPLYPTLADVPAGQVWGKHSLVQKYCTAVYSWAKCQLLKEYPTMNRKKEAANVGKESPERCRDLLERFETAIEAITSYDAELQTFSPNNLRMSLI